MTRHYKLFRSFSLLLIAVSFPLLTLTTAHPLQAQQLRRPATVPLRSQAAVVFPFETPDTTAYGRSIGRLLAHTLARDLEGSAGVHMVVLTDPLLPISQNPATTELVAAQHDAVLALWGEYYAEGDSMLITPHLGITPGGRFEEKDMGLQYNTDEGSLNALPPGMQVNFAPVRIPRTSFDQFVAAFPDTAVVTTAENAAGARAGTITNTMGYHVTGTGAHSQRIVTDQGVAGWVAMPDSMPRIFAHVASFTASVSRYLAGEYQQAREGMAAWTSEHPAGSENAMALAFAHLLTGNAGLLDAQSRGKSPDHRDAEREFATAAELTPESTAATDHLTIARVQRYTDPDAPAISDTVPELNTSELDLISTVQRDGSEQSVDNLRVFYKLANRHKYLKRSDIDDDTYTQSLNRQLGVLSRIDQKQEFVVVIRPMRQVDFLDIRAGLWFPKDKEKAFTYENVTQQGTIDQAQAYGLDFHHHAQMFGPFHGDFTLGVWYSSYRFDGSAIDIVPGQPTNVDAWAVTVPVHLGLSFAPMTPMFISPWAGVGVGGAFAVSSRTVMSGKVRLSDDNRSQGAFAGYGAVGVTLYFTRSTGFALGARYEFLRFKTELLTGQQDLSGVQLTAGFTTRL